MFYEQLLRLKIPKAQRRLANGLYFFALLRSALEKAARKTLVKLITDINFPNT
jgi:hypothetical protein